MKSITVTASVKRLPDGEVEFKIIGRAPFLKMISHFILQKQDECEAIVTVKKSARPKTNEQLGYYFGVVCHYVATGFKGLGYNYMDITRADYELRMMFFYEEHESPSGAKRYPSSLESATVIEVAELIDQSIEFCATHFGIEVPAPDKKGHNV